MNGQRRMNAPTDAEPAVTLAAQAPTTVAPRIWREHVLSSTDVEAKPWRPFADQPGVRDKVLWEDPSSGSYAGIMELAPRARVRPHVHHAGVHHLYVVCGSCELSVSERVLGPNAYGFVPAGALHGIDEAGPEGCTIFFLTLAASLPSGDRP
jgi:quercetin dioxygenase-like cupin family protein